jgi:hypothetical protein
MERPGHGHAWWGMGTVGAPQAAAIRSRESHHRNASATAVGIPTVPVLPTHARTGRPLTSDLRAEGVPKDDVDSRDDITASVHLCRKMALNCWSPVSVAADAIARIG